jgi:alkaline phosphatase D
MRRLLLTVCVLAWASPGWADDPRVLSRIAFGSCANQDKPLPIFDTIAAAKPELLLLLGDTMYADLDRQVKVTPELIREKYAQLEKVPGFARLKALCPRLGTWDDHDYGKNDGGAEWELKDAAQQAFLDFFGVPMDHPRRQQKGVYHAEIFGPPGKRVQIILLDTRYFRSPIKTAFDPQTRINRTIPNTDPGATFLGEEQWKWLEEQLKKPAELRLLVSSIQVISDNHPFEKWANIPKERERLYSLIASTKANGVLILSGDRHLAEISLDTQAVGYPLYDITSSGFNQAAKSWRAPEKNDKRVAAMPYGDNFGFITIDWASDDPRVAVQIRDEDGDATAGFKVRLSTLKGAGGVPVQPKLPEGVLSPAEAAKKVGERVTVQFVVQSVGGKTNLYLNSTKDFRAKENFAIVLGPKVQTGKWEKAGPETFVGKTVRANGIVRLNKDSPQLVIEDAKDLELIEK